MPTTATPPPASAQCAAAPAAAPPLPQYLQPMPGGPLPLPAGLGYQQGRQQPAGAPPTTAPPLGAPARVLAAADTPPLLGRSTLSQQRLKLPSPHLHTRLQHTSDVSYFPDGEQRRAAYKSPNATLCEKLMVVTLGCSHPILLTLSDYSPRSLLGVEVFSLCGVLCVMNR